MVQKVAPPVRIARNGPTAFGRALIKIREEKGWSQSDLARLLKMDKNQISQYETGHRPWPHIPTLLYIAETIPASILLLLGRSPQR